MKIFFYALREFDELGYAKKFSTSMGIEFGWSPNYPDLSNAELARGYDAISCTPVTLDKKMLDAFSAVGVRYVLCRSIGYDHVDLEYAKKLHMRVSNVSYPPSSVANYAIMLMLMCARNMQEIMKRSEVQDYSLKGKIGRDISGCTVGILGTGRIGTEVIKHLSGFGCRLLAYDLYKNEEAAKYAEYVSFEELLAQSDIVTLHMNASESNYHLIDRDAINTMKDQVIIINTSRGKLIDTDALIAGLESGKVGGAGLDVLEKEDDLYYINRSASVIVNHGMAILRSFPNVIVSPHTAFYTRIDVENMVGGNFKALKAFEENVPTYMEVRI